MTTFDLMMVMYPIFMMLLVIQETIEHGESSFPSRAWAVLVLISSIIYSVADLL
jgi:hypothetical protein